MKTRIQYFKFIFLKNIWVVLILFCALPNEVIAQAFNSGAVNITGIAYLNSSLYNISTASYQNNGNFYLTGDFKNDQSGMVAGTGTTYFVGTATQNINNAVGVGQPPYFNNVTITNSTATGVRPALDIYVAGDWVNNGTFTHNSNKVTFNGAVNAAISGSSSTAFYGFILAKGIDITTILDINTSATVAENAITYFDSGLLRVNSGVSFIKNAGNGGMQIDTTGGVHVNGGIFGLNIGASIDNDGLFRVDNTGVGTVGIVSGNSLTNSRTSIFNMQSGTLTIAGRLMNTAGTATIAGGTITVCSIGNGSSDAGSFDMSKTTGLTMSGGTVIFQTTSSAPGIKRDLKILSGTGIKTITGGTFQFGNGSTTANSVFRVYSDIDVYNLTANILNGGGQVWLSKSINTATLSLNKGIFVTNDNLFTLKSAAGLTLPTTYTDSYIATCDSLGNALVGTGLDPFTTTPFPGSMGFRVNSVSGSSDVFFPVSSDLVSPNRMAINMNGSATSNFTVVVGKGDILNTGSFRVNRIWYVNSSVSTGITANMKLYFTKRDWTVWPFGEDEIEAGFTYGQMRLVQKDYSGNAYFINESSGLDVRNYIVGLNGTETYAQYTLGVSANFTGINQFNKFSVIDGEDIILPVTITNIKAWQDGSNVQVAWTSSNEINIDHYEVERALDAQHFIYLGKVEARNNSITANYQLTDVHPANGSNYYRIKVFDKNGAISYTSIVVVNLSKGIARIFIYPNPVQQRLFNLQFSNVDAGNYKLQVYDGRGRLIAGKQIEHFGGSATQQVILPAGTAAGVYKVILFNNDAVIYNTTLVVAD